VTAESWTLPLPWERPPLSLNDRHDRHAAAKLTKQIRALAKELAEDYTVGAHERVAVELHWQVPRRGVYDEENPVATYKAICDGLVDAGVVADDDRYRMSKHMPVLHDPVKGEPGRCWLLVTPLPPIEGAPPPRAKPKPRKPKERTAPPPLPRVEVRPRRAGKRSAVEAAAAERGAAITAPRGKRRKGPAVLPIEQLIADLQPPDGGAAWRARVAARDAEIRRQRG
jgi:crossover junction endodeoxyribonuclease RusA